MPSFTASLPYYQLHNLQEYITFLQRSMTLITSGLEGILSPRAYVFMRYNDVCVCVAVLQHTMITYGGSGVEVWLHAF
jgi:hypothetical protein